MVLKILDGRTENFICYDCEQKDAALNEVHTRMHTVVKVSEEVGKEPSTEERLRFVEDELAKMRRTLAEVTETLGKLVEKSAGWPQVDQLLAKGDSSEDTAAIDTTASSRSG